MEFKSVGDLDKKELKEIERVWKKKEADILEELGRIMKIKTGTGGITCKVNPDDGNGYYGKNNIAIGVYDNPQVTLYVMTHELIHIFYWRKLKELKLTKSVLGKEKKWEWALSEFVVYLIQKEPKMRKFWSDEKISLYPQVKRVKELVGKFWKGKDFDNFLIKSYSLLKGEFY